MSIKSQISQQIKNSDARKRKDQEVAQRHINKAKENAELKNFKGVFNNLYKSEQLYRSSPTVLYEKLAEVYHYMAQYLYILGYYHKAI
jgi:type III secretion system FlhB-like substrate exporter